MDWKAKLKEKAQEHIISELFVLITLLLLVIWQAIPSSTWDKISEAIPKQALWAALALALIALFLESTFLLDHRRKAKKQSNPTEPEQLIVFGLLWDKDLNPRCPADQTPLHTFRYFEHYENLMCPKCSTVFPLRDAMLGQMTLQEARNLIQSRQQRGLPLN